jgi:hypothetical protein
MKDTIKVTYTVWTKEKREKEKVCENRQNTDTEYV